MSAFQLLTETGSVASEPPNLGREIALLSGGGPNEQVEVVVSAGACRNRRGFSADDEPHCRFERFAFPDSQFPRSRATKPGRLDSDCRAASFCASVIPD